MFFDQNYWHGEFSFLCNKFEWGIAREYDSELHVGSLYLSIQVCQIELVKILQNALIDFIFYKKYNL